jgi:organic hydroperoxide reductase OsmC/OhrA
MTDIETTTVSEAGFVSTSAAGDFELTIDATGDDGPTPNQVLVADYAACFIPAVRVGADQMGHDDIGRVQIDADAELDDDDHLAAIRFTLYVEADLDGETLDEVVSRAEGLCHVHAAVREELEADIDAYGDAF